ncbi:SufD family Fe-S cluster assembly protein [Egibacter rhizosphaerae]|uniref:SufD family Fe-S cluster assembly protein n=1 Tax=Egibacter rhizosphaerae TaxID=1670831 RepID=A0A411YJC0_9ACTN|nr:SufD family Fe-S cluster assembly protein [Egibacter rhizosphaerae]QBI21405.1 SufD family Fe-S cluster assembly protein [Egibacter rhizosphaerae]
MATLNDLTEADVVAQSEAAGEPEWLRDARQAAYKDFSDHAWPTNRVEEWRHTDPRRIPRDRELVTAGEAGDIGVRAEGIAVHLEGYSARLRIVDGVVVDASVEPEAAALGVVATDLATAAREHPELVRDQLGAAVGAEDAFTAANLAAFTAAGFIHVPPEVELERPVAVTIQLTRPGTHLPRLLAHFAPNARGDLVIDRTGGADATVVEVVEVVAEAGAAVRVANSQGWDDGCAHVGWHRARVGRDAEAKALEATFGGGTVYLRPDVRMTGEGANGELYGVYFAGGDQSFQHRCLIHHDAARTTSESVYKGALQGESHTVWYGNIRIEPHAKATTSDETNRNLILTDGARADSIPFLEILTSDVVGCGHHSSVGQLDELQLFYMESRGIPRPVAARMLVFGFFSEVLERVEIPGVTEVLQGEIERELQEAPTALMDPRRGAA